MKWEVHEILRSLCVEHWVLWLLDINCYSCYQLLDQLLASDAPKTVRSIDGHDQ